MPLPYGFSRAKSVLATAAFPFDISDALRLLILHRLDELRQRLLHSMRQPCRDMKCGNGVAAFDAADHVPRDATLEPERIHAHATSLTQLLQPTRQPRSA